MAASVWDAAWAQLQAANTRLNAAVSQRDRKAVRGALVEFRRSIVVVRVALKTLGQMITPTESKWLSNSLKDLHEAFEILKWRTKDLEQTLSKDDYARFRKVQRHVWKRVQQCKFELDKREAALPDLPVSADLGTLKGQALVQAKLFREHLLKEVTEPGVRAQLAFEKSVQLGETVQVRWPWGRDTYTAPGKIVKVSAQTFTVALAVPVLFEDRRAWAVGHQIVVPRLTGLGRKWSPQNGVFPV